MLYQYRTCRSALVILYITVVLRSASHTLGSTGHATSPSVLAGRTASVPDMALRARRSILWPGFQYHRHGVPRVGASSTAVQYEDFGTCSRSSRYLCLLSMNRHLYPRTRAPVSTYPHRCSTIFESPCHHTRLSAQLPIFRIPVTDSQYHHIRTPITIPELPYPYTRTPVLPYPTLRITISEHP